MEQIRHTQPRTEGTKPTRNKKKKKKKKGWGWEGGGGGEGGRRNSPKGDNNTYSAQAFHMS